MNSAPVGSRKSQSLENTDSISAFDHNHSVSKKKCPGLSAADLRKGLQRGQHLKLSALMSTASSGENDLVVNNALN